MVTGAKLDGFKAEYQNSEEETRDVLNAYKSQKGKMNAIYARVMMSNPLEDEDRFRAIIDRAIENGEVEAYKAYTDESSKSKEARMKNAGREGAEADAYAQKLGVHDKLFGPGPKNGKKNSKKAGSGEDDLAALFQQRGKGRTENFLDNLEKKYSKDTGRKKRGAVDEPSEEAFERMAKRGKRRKEVEEAVEVDDEGEEVVDLSGDEEEEEEEEVKEEELPKAKKRRTRQTKKTKGRVKKAKA